MGLSNRTRSLTQSVGRGTRKDDAFIYHLPEQGDKVRVTPLGYAGWVSGTVHRVPRPVASSRWIATCMACTGSSRRTSSSTDGQARHARSDRSAPAQFQEAHDALPPGWVVYGRAGTSTS